MPLLEFDKNADQVSENRHNAKLGSWLSIWQTVFRRILRRPQTKDLQAKLGTSKVDSPDLESLDTDFGGQPAFYNRDKSVLVTRYNPKSLRSTVYRFVLAMDADAVQRSSFEANLRSFELQGWLVKKDKTRKNESMAYIVMQKSQDYKEKVAAYIASSSFNRAFQGNYDSRE
jgi:hypothetical protein